jgi:hypothetical protein
MAVLESVSAVCFERWSNALLLSGFRGDDPSKGGVQTVSQALALLGIPNIMIPLVSVSRANGV